ncbi:flagellar assembly protein FliW [Cellulomonas soli]|uniref:flagellar assembly protein FliW n=1 Tax=Cellulomonas soli TaxID=931535 RepID=UPI003F836176
MSAATLTKEAPTVRTSTTLPVRTTRGTDAVPALLTLVDPLPGLPAHDTLELDALDDAGALFALRSTDDTGVPLRLFVVAPDAFFSGYTPDVAATAARLRADGTDAGHTVLVVVHPAGPHHAEPTANLLAPLVVDLASGRAAQVVLEGDWPLRAPLS